MSNVDARQFAIEAARICSDDKCDEVVVLDLRGKSSLTDYFVIATGTSDRHMIATGDHIEEYARKLGLRLFKNRRLDSSVWVLLDFVDTIVHIFDHEHRDYYDLELLWGDAPSVEWARTASA